MAGSGWGDDDAGDEPARGLSEGAVHAFGAVIGRVDHRRVLRQEGPIDPAPPVEHFPRDHARRTEKQTDRPHYWGHRQRVRDRFAAGGGDSMPDYEVVEMLLFNAVPKIDVKPLAKTLLADFGGLERLLTASRPELSAHPKVDHWIVHQLKLAELVAKRLAETRLSDTITIASTDAVIAYCRTVMAHQRVEHFRVLYLGTKHNLIANEEHGRGTVNHTPAYPREIVKRALEHNAVGVILVHNHPSGDPSPSVQDIRVTERIKAGLETVGIKLYDHIIIGSGSETSLAATGAL